MNKSFTILVSVIAALGGLLFGFDTAIISGTIPNITAYFGLDEYSLGWAVSSILIGCSIGALSAGRLADRYGRRTILIGCALLFAVSGIGAALSHQLIPFVLFRLIGGLGVGAAAMVSPMYIAEIAPATWRGRLVACYQLAIVIGILLAYFSNYLFNGIGENSWRWMFASQAAPSALFLVMLFFVPETPRWLVGRGKTKSAIRILEKTAGKTAAHREIRAIEESFRSSSKVAASSALSALFTPAHRPVLFMGILVAIFQQVTGINAILYYAPVIFKETGLDQSSSLLQTIGIGLINVVSTFIAIGLVDKAGRRKLLIAGSVIMGLCLAAVALCFRYHYFENYLVLICMLFYVGAFGCTLGAVTWVYLSEIFPNAIRGLALSVATLALWLADFAVTYAFPVMTKHLGTANTLFCYAALCVLACIYMVFRIRETVGKSLEEIETLFAGESGEIKHRKTEIQRISTPYPSFSKSKKNL